MSSLPHTLMLLRHAKSDWSGGEPDRERPLAKRGRRQAQEAGRWLAGSGHDVDLAVVSPAARARSTWELVCAELATRPPTRFDERVYDATRNALIDVVRELPEFLDTVLLVGHNPAIEDLATLLADEPVPMPTSALAVLALSEGWSSAGRRPAQVVACGRPPVP